MPLMANKREQDPNPLTRHLLFHERTRVLPRVKVRHRDDRDATGTDIVGWKTPVSMLGTRGGTTGHSCPVPYTQPSRANVAEPPERRVSSG